MVGDRIEGKVLIESITYFKDDWGIIKVSPVDIKEGKPKLSNNTFVIKGKMIKPMVDKEYDLIATEVYDPRYHEQYDVISLSSNIYVDENDSGAKRKYLEHLFTEKQVEHMYTALEDPFTVLKERNYALLTRVYGCRVRTAEAWIKRFEDNYIYSRIYTELADCDLTPSAVRGLVDHYGSPEMVIHKVRENPYSLVEVGGIGFVKADKIALKGGMAETDPRRVAHYIRYILNECGQIGKSFLDANGQLLPMILEFFGEDLPDEVIMDALKSNVLKNLLWFSEDRQYIGLKRYYDLEHRLAEEIIRISGANKPISIRNLDEQIKNIEARQGWEYTDQQRKAIETVLNKNLVVIEGKAGCVDCDTEFFNGFGWKRIADYKTGDMVLQYNINGSAELVEPKNYIKQKSDILYHFETKYGVNQTLSPEHNIVYYSPKGKFYKRPFKEILEETSNGKNFYGKFITSFIYGGSGIDLTDNEIRLMIAIFADGHFEKCTLKEENTTYRRVRVNLKKERKQKRLEWLLDKCRINWRKVPKVTSGHYDYFFEAPYLGKHFTPDWYSCTQHQLGIITEEIMNWDGYYNKQNYYSTASKEDADFVQFAFTAVGKRATITMNNRVGEDYYTAGKMYKRKSIEYEVHVTDRTLISLTFDNRPDHTNTQFIPVTPKDGYEYCFTVPSGMLILRRGDRVFVTGNCGKTSIATGLIDILKRQYKVAITAFAGKAAMRLSEVAGIEGHTIHRLLAYNPRDGFVFNKDTPLDYDVVIVDEISMIGGELFLNLMEAIPTGSKLILLGDTGQLEAIGSCNVASDLIGSGAVPVVTLDKIHRQAARSAIITESLKIRSGQQIISKDWAGMEVRGELQDLVIDCYSDAQNTYPIIMDYYKQVYEVNNHDVSRIQVIVPVKSRGNASVWNLNLALQEFCNPRSSDKNEMEIYYPGALGKKGARGILREGDKVINTKNNYRTVDIETKETPVFNGNMGIIECIDNANDVAVINFYGIGHIIFNKSELPSISLGYAITVHKFQGSQTDTVIFGIDFSAMTLLSRELVYTGITRAQKRCILVAQNSALRYATSKEAVSEKQTHLRIILNELLENFKKLKK